MKIVVTGSLGNVSRPLALALVQNGHQVTVITHHGERQKDIAALGARAAIGSVDNIDFLATVFKDADAVYTMIPPNYSAPDPLAYYRTIGNCLATAIRDSGVRRIVHLSSWGAHLAKGTGIIVGSYEVEKIFETLADVDICFLRPCSFYNNLYRYTDMIKGVGFIGTNYGGEDKIVLVSPLDIAAAAAEEIEASHTGKSVRYVASDERSCREIAKVLGTAIGQPDLQWLAFTDEQTQSMMEKNGVSASMAAQRVELNSSIRTGLIREDYDLHKPAVMGKVKLEEFAVAFAAAFKQK
jgi:uncharacterized protein YbjT (DUF2867 family)